MKHPHPKGLCGRCGEANDRLPQRWCRLCHNAYAREWKRRHPPRGEARRRAVARAYANVYKRRGLLLPQPCEVCAAPMAQMHHDDYSRPLAVRWLCREHHGILTASST